MKHRHIDILLLLFVWASVPVEAQLYKPFSSFRVIKTERFDIIFPKESEPSARLLASYADNVYEQVSSLLGIEVPRRIPVTFSPHTDLFNAYHRLAPYSHIVIYDTPANLEWTNFANHLESLFLHELTHAVSLNTRGPGWRWLERVFGSWASPSLLYAPLFMVEGVTVSFESLSGFGRANDPLIKQKLRQAIHEEKFLTPFQASGVYDLPGQSGIYYEYGGLFSAWLQQNYGMEKYAELWQALGKDSRFSFFVYRSGYYRAFKNVYGIDFMDAWNAFSASLSLNDLEENPEELLPKQHHFFSEKKKSISALAVWENSVYFIDGTEEKIRVYDTHTGQIRAFNTSFPFSYDVDVSSDGAALLVSGYQAAGERYRAVVTEHRTDSGWKTGRTIKGLYRARYFRNGVIGIRSELHNTCIVYEDFNGNSEILFKGNEELLFSGPQAVDDERIVFVAARKGVRELLLYNYVSGELFRIENSDGNNEYWRYMRGLGVSEGKLFFSHNADDRMYKLASIDLKTMRAVLSERDFSGGVFYPVCSEGTVYYRGEFFSGDGLLRFPETAGSLSGKQIDLILVNPDNLDSPSIPPYSGPSKMYFGLKYMNPFKYWVPLPLIREADDNIFGMTLDGGGLFSVLMDATDRNMITFVVHADIKYRMAAIESFVWQSTVPGFPLTVEFSDMVMIDSDGDPYRNTSVGLSGSFTRSPGSWSYGFSLGGGYVRFADDDGGETAYTWKETGSAFFLSTGLVFSSLRRRQNELFGNGLSLSLRGVSIIDNFMPRVEGLFKAGAETRFPLNLILYGAYDEGGMNLHGVSPVYGDPLFAKGVSVEFPLSSDLNLTWLGRAEASVGLFSLEIQKNLSHVYYNRFFGTLSLRNILYDGKNYSNAEGIAINDLRLTQSLMLKLGLVSSFIPLKSVPFFIEPCIWGAWNFSNTITGKGSAWNWGLSFNYFY